MFYKELEYRCVTCNIELIVIDSIFLTHRKYVYNNLRKLRKHRKKGHKIISNYRSVFHDVNGFMSIPYNDVVTKYILENGMIIYP